MRKLFKSLLVASLATFSLSLAIEDLAEKVTLTTASSGNHQKLESFKEKAIKIINFSLPIGTAIGGSFMIHRFLEYTSVALHEYGHSLLCFDTKIEIASTGDVLSPFRGQCTGKTAMPPIVITFLGPCAGILSKVLQVVLINKLIATLSKLPSSKTTQTIEDPESPSVKNIFFHYFTRARALGKNGISKFINFKDISTIDPEELDEIVMNIALNSLLTLRVMSIISESMYGFLPYKVSSGNIAGDGEKLWKFLLLGNNPPTFSINLPEFSLGLALSPYIVGAMEAIRENIQNNL